MKRLFCALTIASALLLVVTSCTTGGLENVIHDDALHPTKEIMQTQLQAPKQMQELTQTQNANGTQTQTRTTQAKNKATYAPYTGEHLPHWAEDLNLNDGEMHLQNIHYSYQGYSSIDELTTAAKRYIARVEVLDKRVEMLNSSLSPEFQRYDINTIYRLKVLEVFKGNARSSEIIELALDGGQIDNLSLVADPVIVPLTLGEDLVVFLSGVNPEEYKEYPVAKFAVVVNPWQSFYRAEPKDGNTFRSLHPDNDLVLTKVDLERIKQTEYSRPVR